MNKYKLNAINYLRAEIKTARKAREENNISTLRTVCNMIRSELDYCSTIGIFSLENKNMLIKIAERMIYNNDSR